MDSSKMEDNLLNSLSEQFGLGEFPILNEFNRELHKKLIQREIDVVKLKSECEQEIDNVNGLYKHFTHTNDEINAKRYLVTAKREALGSENDFLKIALVCKDRNLKEANAVDIIESDLRNEIADFERRIYETDEVINHFQNEIYVDLETINKWSRDIDDYEEDILNLLKYQHNDEIKIKEILLKLEKIREKVSEQKNYLESSSMNQRMAQLALDKTAEEFRVIHKERQEVMNKWQESLELVAKRDNELEVVFENVNNARNAVRKNQIELKEQESFLQNEVGNNKELEHQIINSEKKATKLKDELDMKENELDSLDNDIVLERRQSMKLSMEINQKRAKLKELKADRNAKMKRMQILKNHLEDLKMRKEQTSSLAMTSEEKALEMERMLDEETKQQELLQWELDKIRDKKLQKEKELKEIVIQEEANSLRIRAFTLEQKNLSSKVKSNKNEVQKKEDVLERAEHQLAQIERQVAKLKGKIASENRSEMKIILEGLKKELEKKDCDKRNMDYLLHKMKADVKKVNLDIDQLRRDESKVTANLEEIALIIETSKKHQKTLNDSLEALLLEEKMLKLTESKSRDEVKNIIDELCEVKKQDLIMTEQMLEQREDLTAKRDMYQVQQRNLRDELSSVRQIIRERIDRVEKLKIRYDQIIKSLGDIQQKDKREVPSHAYHMIKIAQEKAELEEEGIVLNQKIEKEEKDLIELEKAINFLKNSNGKYRSTNMKRDMMDNEDVRHLQHKVKVKSEEIEAKKNQIGQIELSIKQKESIIARSDNELATAKEINDCKEVEVATLDREIKEQDKKVVRAQRSKSAVSRDMREHVANVEIYEQDMDLRLEKEKQRSALIKLRELSFIDQNFSQSCHEEIDKIGLSIPVPSRLESNPAVSRPRTPLQPIRRPSGSRARNVMFRTGNGVGGRSRRSSSESRTEKERIILLELNNIPGHSSQVAM